MQKAASPNSNNYFDFVLALIGAGIAAYICLPISKDGEAYLSSYQDASNYSSAEYLFWIWLDCGDHWHMPLSATLLPMLLITMAFKLKAFRSLGANTWYIFPVYLSVFYLLHEGTQLRISCALALSLWSCVFTMRRQWLLVVLLGFSAAGFHITAPFLPIVFGFCYHSKKMRHFSWWALAGGVLMYLANLSIIDIVVGQFAAILGGRYTMYSGSLIYDQNTTGLMFVFAFMLAGLLAFLALWGRSKLQFLPTAYPALVATSVY
jgi:hypothetical protein